MQREILQKRNTLNKFPTSSKIMGDFYEEILRDDLRKHIPQKYGIFHGMLIKSGDNDQIIKWTNELDLIIVDLEKFSPLFKANDIIIASSQSVKIVAQIKSALNTINIESAIKNLGMVKLISPEIYTVLIGFERYRKPSTIQRLISEEDSGNHSIDEVVYFSRYIKGCPRDNIPKTIELGQYEKLLNIIKQNL